MYIQCGLMSASGHAGPSLANVLRKPFCLNVEQNWLVQEAVRCCFFKIDPAVDTRHVPALLPDAI